MRPNATPVPPLPPLLGRVFDDMSAKPAVVDVRSREAERQLGRLYGLSWHSPVRLHCGDCTTCRCGGVVQLNVFSQVVSCCQPSLGRGCPADKGDLVNTASEGQHGTMDTDVGESESD